MPIEITVPRLGWSSEEGIFAGWLKQPGDQVVAGEPLFALESDKVTMEVESLDHGRLHVAPGCPEAGQVVLVGQLLGYLLAEGEELAPLAAPQPVVPALSQEPAVAFTPRVAPGAASKPLPRPDRMPASPRARAAAKRLGIDLVTVAARPGARRVIEADVLRAAQASHATTSPAAPSPSPAQTRARKYLAARLEESFRTPHFYVQATTDAAALAAFLAEMRPHVEQQHGARLTYNDLLVKALALALRTVPQVNRFWNNGEIAAHATIDVSLAVQTDDNLLAPVIRNVAALTIGEIAAERERLVEKCRRGAARPEDFAGGSVTLSNLGPFGVDRFQAILNPGQSAILAVGSIAKRPFVDGDAVIVRLTAPLTLSVDHRVVDGVAAAKFLQAIVSLLESPMRLVL